MAQECTTCGHVITIPNRLLNARTKRELGRQRDTILRAAWKRAEGGTAFGIDWRTLHLAQPDSYHSLLFIDDVCASLPD